MFKTLLHSITSIKQVLFLKSFDTAWVSLLVDDENFLLYYHRMPFWWVSLENSWSVAFQSLFEQAEC